jgi:hypothetical protein
VTSATADSGRRKRIVGGSLRLGLDLSIAAIGGIALAGGVRNKDTALDVGGGVLIGVGALAAVVSILEVAGPSFEEDSHRLFIHGEALGASSQRIYSLAERRLFYAAEKDRKQRTLSRWLGLAGFLLEGNVLVSLAIRGDAHDPTLLGVGAAGMLLGGALFIDSLFPTTTERMADLWRNDPSRPALRSSSDFKIRPTFGLGGAGFAGTF